MEIDAQYSERRDIAVIESCLGRKITDIEWANNKLNCEGEEK